ncbi:hypothetical protein Tco_1379269 [Tanacetum coccineum]
MSLLASVHDEDEEVEESSDSDSKSEDAVDEGPTAEDEGPDAGVAGCLVWGKRVPGMRRESLDLGGDGRVYLSVSTDPKRPERVSALRQPTLTTWIDPEDDRVYIDIVEERSALLDLAKIVDSIRRGQDPRGDV